MQTLDFEQWYDSRSEEQYKTNVQQFLDIYEKLPACHKTGPWIVGGTIRRLLAGEELITDIDVMFKDVANYEDYCSQLRELGAETIAETPHQSTFKLHGWEIQPIKAVFSNTLIQTLNKFDFTICQFGFDGENLVWGDHSMEHLEQKQLVFTQTTDPISTMRRMFKYAEQGFRMDTKTITKFLNTVWKQQDDLAKADRKWNSKESDAFASGGFRGLARGVSSYSV